MSAVAIAEAIAEDDAPIESVAAPLVLVPRSRIRMNCDELQRRPQFTAEEITNGMGRWRDEQRAARGIEHHEAMHFVVSVLCGDRVDHCCVGPRGGHVYSLMRQERTTGSIISQLAVTVAGEVGYLRATDDPDGARGSACQDREDIADFVKESGLAGTGIVERATETATMLVEAIADHAWLSVVAVADCLRARRRVAGDELLELVRVTPDFVEKVRSVVA